MDIIITLIATISGFIFGICFLFLMFVSKITGLSYTEVSVYINLYLQGMILLLSSFLIFYNSYRKLIKELNAKNILKCLFSTIYFGIYLFLFYGLFKHYGLNTTYAFNLCQSELMEFIKYLPKYNLNLEISSNWINYYIINILIFIIGFIGILIINYKINKYICK